MKKRIISLFITICMALSFMPVISLPAFAAITAEEPIYGDGSPNNPYQIASAENLTWFRDQVNAGKTDLCANLTSDIDLSGDDNWLPIGSWATTRQYSGTFDGRNHTIRNLKINDTNQSTGQYLSVFGRLVGGTVKNLHVRGGDITGVCYIGGITGEIQGGTISNCSFDGELTGVNPTLYSLGGIVGGTGLGSSVIQNCWTGGTFSGYASIGGILGVVFDGKTDITIDRCFSTASVTCSRNSAGGLVGYCGNNTTLKISDSYFAGRISSAAVPHGRIIGYPRGGTMNTTRVITYTTDSTELAGGGSAKVTWGYTRNLVTSNPSTTATTATGNANLTENMFLDKENFPTYDFDGKETNPPVWDMGEKHPVLHSYVDVAGGDAAMVTVSKSEDSSIRIPDYFTLVDMTELAETEEHAFYQYNRFTFDITDGGTTTKSVMDADTGLYADKQVRVASVVGDTLTLDSDISAGTYPMTIKAVADKENGGYGEFEVKLNVVVKEVVPVPHVLSEGFTYSRNMSLNSVFLTEGWTWVDGTICPKPNRSYKAYYQFDADADYYDTSALDAANIEYTVDTELGRVIVDLDPKVTDSDTAPSAVTFTVINADTDAPIEGATVEAQYEDEFESADFADSVDGMGKIDHTTDASGVVLADMSPGKHTVYTSATGFTAAETEIETTNSVADAFTIKLVPERYKFTMPIVKDKDTDAVISNARVTITRLNTDVKTNAWNVNEETGKSSNSLTADAKAEVDLPDGEFEVKSATYGYTTQDKLYLVVKDGAATYYTDSAFGAEASADRAGVLAETKMTEPMYTLKIDKAGEYYIGKLYLKNIKATYGTFGIRYDNDLLKLTGITMYNNLKNKGTVEDLCWAEDEWTTENSLGYYDFVWSAGDGKDSEFDTETATGNGLQIADFKFEIKDGADANDMTVDSFGIEPWDETQAAKDFKKLTPSGTDTKFWQHWRYIDKDNNKVSLKQGRIEASKSVVNGIETNGFFQAAVNADLGNADESAYFYDVMTVLEYGFDMKNSVIRIHTIDDDTEDDLQGVTVKLFDTGSKLFGTRDTNLAGRANFAVDTSGSVGNDFTYTAKLNGYWPIPESGLLSDRPAITAQTGKATEVEVRMEKKIYHVPVMIAGEQTSIELVADADLGGEKYAYNNRPFHFRIKGARGYRIKKYPDKAIVRMNGEVIDEITPDGNQLFELKGDKVTGEALSKKYMEETLGYTEVDDQPDAEGYRSYNLEIEFSGFEVDELAYTVNAQTNDGGTVEYDPDTPINGGLAADEGSTDHNITVTTVRKKDAEDHIAKRQTGTFKFKAEGDNIIEKVYINGLQIHTYDDLKGFTYSFGDVDMDCSIIVLYWDGVTHSEDSVLTLVVGDYGSANVTSPIEDEYVSFTRRVYLNPKKNLEFTTAPMTDDYSLYAVEKQNNDLPRVNITKSDNHTGQYSIAPIEGESVTVYVTFKNNLASKTPNLFVKSYIYFGDGVADPAGILIYSMYDSPEIKLTANTADSWQVRGVMISPYDDMDNVDEWDFDELSDEATYRYDSLTKSIAIGAIFEEKSYKLHGKVDLSQDSAASKNAPKSGAVVRFVRLDNNGNELKKQVPFETVTTVARKDAGFSIDLPAGKWNVYVKKQGYLTYLLKNFEMPANPDAVTEFGMNAAGDKQWAVIPYIGSVDGNWINLYDAAAIESGWRDGANASMFAKADMDNDNNISTTDMAYVWFNFNKLFITQEYENFRENGSDIEAYKEKTN